jgi:hypothetical protein
MIAQVLTTIIAAAAALAFLVACARLWRWASAPMTHPDRFTQLWQEREVRQGRFPESRPLKGAKPGKPGATKRRSGGRARAVSKAQQRRLGGGR